VRLTYLIDLIESTALAIQNPQAWLPEKSTNPNLSSEKNSAQEDVMNVTLIQSSNALNLCS
jgi:hypothetical protein